MSTTAEQSIHIPAQAIRDARAGAISEVCSAAEDLFRAAQDYDTSDGLEGRDEYTRSFDRMARAQQFIEVLGDDLMIEPEPLDLSPSWSRDIARAARGTIGYFRDELGNGSRDTSYLRDLLERIEVLEALIAAVGGEVPS